VHSDVWLKSTGERLSIYDIDDCNYTVVPVASRYVPTLLVWPNNTLPILSPNIRQKRH